MPEYYNLGDSEPGRGTRYIVRLMRGVPVKWRNELLQSSAALVLFFLLMLTFFPSAVYAANEKKPDDVLFPGSSPSEGAQEQGAQQEGTTSLLSDIQFSGYVKNETAYRYRAPRTITKIRNVAYLNAKYPYSSRFKFNFSAWAYYDLAYNLFDYDAIAGRLERNSEEPLAFIVNLPREKDSPAAAVRELYMDMFLGSVDVRLGKQYVVWGVLEGVRITDEINPIDFRELILPDLLDYRISQWMAKLDYYRDEASYQLLWIPHIEFHKPAPPGSEWELLQEVPGTRKPANELQNSELGFKISTKRWDTELAFSYFYTWDDFPVIFRRVRLNDPATPQFMPTYTRISMYGATFIKQLNDFIVKGELAYVTDKYFGIADVDRNRDGFLDHNGELKRDHIRWGLGTDYNWRGFDVSPSFVQWVILNYDNAMIQDEFDSSFNVFIRKEFPESSIVFQLLGIYLINLEELYLKPKWTFRITDRFQIATGLDIFTGNKSQFGVAASSTAFGGVAVTEQRAQFIGNFRDNDRLFLEFKYSF